MTYDEKVEAMIQGVNRFLFYNWNFDSVPYDMNVYGTIRHIMIPRVIVEAEWNCDVDHIIDKWFAATKFSEPDAYFPRLYAELSVDNRRAFLTWIINNYKGEQQI